MTAQPAHLIARARRRLRHRSGGAGFTIIELLVVVAIIIILVGLLIVAVNAASRSAQRTSTVALMNSISKGLVSFNGDIGYYPPLLGPTNAPAVELRKLFNPPLQTVATYQADVQNWYSTCAMADYLVGWDVGNRDGYGYPAQNETPATGIRHPDSDGVWGASVAGFAVGTPDGSLASRNPPLTGKKYGPYIEISDPNLMGSTDGTYDSLGNLNIYFPGDPLYNDAGPKILCDYWGAPIRYYRRPHPPGALGQSYRSGTDINEDGVVDGEDIVPTLSDIYLLRPWTIRPGAESVNRFADLDGKNTSARNLDAAEYALFSSGADKSYNQNVTVDATTNVPNSNNEYNKDNIVEVGP